MQDRAIVTMEGEYETTPKLSSGTRLNDLEWSLTQISTSRYYSTLNNSKTVPDRAIFTMGTNRKSYMVYRTAPFWMTLNDLEWLSEIFNNKKHRTIFATAELVFRHEDIAWTSVCLLHQIKSQKLRLANFWGNVLPASPQNCAYSFPQNRPQ